MTSYVGAVAQDGILAEAVTSAQRSNHLSMLRYQEGALALLVRRRQTAACISRLSSILGRFRKEPVSSTPRPDR
jgi:hypothetical protein